jgi:hypothetical protein
MDKVKLTNWKLNDKQQIEADIEGNRHLSREEVGRRVVLLAGETAYEVRLFAIGLVFHGPGKPHGAAVKLKVTEGSKFTLEELVKAMEASKEHYLVVKNDASDKPAGMFEKHLE